MGKKTIDIRVRVKASDSSLEALLDEYLHSDATPYPMREMVLTALLSYWLPLIYQEEGATPEKVRQSLVDANYRWQLHLQYLQERTGISIEEELPTSSTQTSSSPQTVSPAKAPFDLNTPTDAETKLENTEEEEEGEYPDLFD